MSRLFSSLLVVLLTLLVGCVERLPQPDWIVGEGGTAQCKDGVMQGTEQCDDGNQNDDDACTNNCELARCGDNIVRNDLQVTQPGYEACDDGNDLDSDGCIAGCQTSRCGDGLVQLGVEECDDANPTDNDACTSACLTATCGDGIVRMGVLVGAEGFEACDDANDIDIDACRNDCSLAACGDGMRRTDTQGGQPGYEACDDGNEINEDGCTNACVAAFCGDGITRIDLSEGTAGYEACDDANPNDRDACRNDCAAASCGDAVRRQDLQPNDEGYEACDDGNQIDSDACRTNCDAASCGDGVLRTDLIEGQGGYEGCDDGNDDDEDICRNDCTRFPDGSSRAMAVANCAKLREVYPNSNDGIYWVSNPNNVAIESSCDFTTSPANGPWTRCLFAGSDSGSIRPSAFAKCRNWGGTKLLFKAYDEVVPSNEVIQVAPRSIVRVIAPSATVLNQYLNLNDTPDTHRWQFQTNQWQLTRIGGSGTYDRYLSLNYAGRICIGVIIGNNCIGSGWQRYRVEICAGPSAVMIPGNNDHNYLFCFSSSAQAANQGLRLGTVEYGRWGFEVFTNAPAD